jgi:arsenate reductase
MLYMSQPPYNVLFICSGNSARSIFAEAILNRIGGDKFRAFSAGTRPGSQLNDFAVAVLKRNGLETEGLRAKHISEFESADAPKMDFIFTVCDAAAAEECAPWPGQPMTAHWGVPDPVKATGTEAEKGLAFAKAFSELNRRIMAFSALSIEQLDRLALQRSLDTIGLNPA